jgi:hypothetical protein
VTGPFREAKAGTPKITGDKATVSLMAGSATESVTLEKRGDEWLLTRAPGT